MTKKKKSDSMPTDLLSVGDDVKNLLDLFEFFLTERQLGKSIDVLGDIVRDMRLIIGRMLSDHFMSLSTAKEKKFCTALANTLADRAATIPVDSETDREYFDYCIGEVLTSFEYAGEVKESYPNDPVLQKILALDIPILRPFDYGMRKKLKLLVSKKKRISHG